MFRVYNSGKLLFLVFVVYYADLGTASFVKVLDQNITMRTTVFNIALNCLEKEYKDIMAGKMPRSSWKSSFIHTDCIGRSLNNFTVIPVRDSYLNITMDCFKNCLTYDPTKTAMVAKYVCPNEGKKVSWSKVSSVDCLLPYASSRQQFFCEARSYTPQTYIRISAQKTTWFLTIPPELIRRESPAVIKYDFGLNLQKIPFLNNWSEYRFHIYIQLMPYALNDRCKIQPDVGMSAATWFSVDCSDLSEFTQKGQFYYSLYFNQPVQKTTKYVITKQPLTQELNIAFQLPKSSQSTKTEVSLYVFIPVPRGVCFETKALFVITAQPFFEAKSLDTKISSLPSNDRRINFQVTSSLVQVINEFSRNTTVMSNILSPSELRFRIDRNAWRRVKMLELMVNLKPVNKSQDDELAKLVNNLTSVRNEMTWVAYKPASVLYKKLAMKLSDRPSSLSAKSFAENLLTGIGSLVNSISEEGGNFAGKANKTVTSSFVDAATALMKSGTIIGQGLSKINKFSSGYETITVPDMLFSLKTSNSNEICKNPMKVSLLSHSKWISATFTCIHYASPNVIRLAISSLYALKNPFAIFDSSRKMNFPILSVNIFDEKFNKMGVKSVTVKYSEPKTRFHIEWITQTLRFASHLNGTYLIPKFDKYFSIPLIEVTSPATSLRQVFINVIGGPFKLDIIVQHKQRPTYNQLITNSFKRNVDSKVLTNNNQNYSVIIPIKYTGNDTYYIVMVPLQNYTKESISRYISAKQNDTILVRMQIGTLAKSCFHWDLQRSLWSTDNCIPVFEPSDDVNNVSCECNHLSIMTANLFVPQNLFSPIEDLHLDQLFENPIIFVTMIYIWTIYAFLFYWCYRKDQANTFLSSITVLADDLTEHIYFIGVRTRWLPRAGTTARVFLILFGSEGNSTVYYLRDMYKTCFRAGDESWFLLTTEQSIGELQSVGLWHDNSGTSPDWKLDHVIVQDFQTKKIWILHCPDWISLEKGLKSRHVLLVPLNLKQLRSKRLYHLRSKIAKGFRNSHDWLGVLLKTPTNRFTHTQRLMCTFNLILSIMLGNILFYGIPTDNPGDQSLTGGSMKALVISIETSLVIIPIGFILTKLFSWIRPRFGENITKEGVEENLKCTSEQKYRENREQAARNGTEEADANQNAGNKTSESQHSENDDGRSIKKYLDWFVSSTPTSGFLPSWFIYITWIINAIYCFICTYFIILYGLKYGLQESSDWLLSFILSFFLSVVIFQPLVIVLKAFLSVAFLLKRIKLDYFGLKIRKVSDDKFLEMVCEQCHFEDEYTSLIPSQCGQRLATKMTTNKRWKHQLSGH